VTNNEVGNFSQEIRLTSDNSYRARWIVGASFTKTDVYWFQNIDLDRSNHQVLALFGQLIVPFAEHFEFVGGLGCTDEERSYTGATVRSAALAWDLQFLPQSQ
jgi:hypothetical protein